ARQQEQAQHQRRRKAEGSLQRQEDGVHVRDDQAGCRSPQVSARPESGTRPALPAGCRACHPAGFPRIEFPAPGSNPRAWGDAAKARSMGCRECPNPKHSRNAPLCAHSLLHIPDQPTGRSKPMTAYIRILSLACLLAAAPLAAAQDVVGKMGSVELTAAEFKAMIESLSPEARRQLA